MRTQKKITMRKMSTLVHENWAMVGFISFTGLVGIFPNEGCCYMHLFFLLLGCGFDKGSC